MRPYYQNILDTYRWYKKAMGAKIAREDIKQTLFNAEWEKKLQENPKLRESMERADRLIRERNVAIALAVQKGDGFDMDRDLDGVKQIAKTVVAFEIEQEKRINIKVK